MKLSICCAYNERKWSLSGLNENLIMLDHLNESITVGIKSTVHLIPLSFLIYSVTYCELYWTNIQGNSDYVKKCPHLSCYL